MPIIDCHVHLNKYDKIRSQAKEFMSLGNRLDALIQSMNKNNVDYSIVISSYKVDVNRPSTSQIIDIVSKNENIRNRIGIVTGFTIDNHTEEDLKQCRIWLKDGLIKGMKLYSGYEHYYPYDKKYQNVYDICMEYRVPVMIHTGDAYSSTAKLRYAHPLNIDDIVLDAPSMPGGILEVLLDTQEWLARDRRSFMTLHDVYQRAESRRKGRRARLTKTVAGREKRAEWTPKDSAEAEPLHYRWRQVRQLLIDLQEVA